MKLEDLKKMGILSKKRAHTSPRTKIPKESKEEAKRLLRAGARCIDVALITGINGATVRGISASLK